MNENRLSEDQQVLCAVDSWSWSFLNGLQLGAGRVFGFDGFEFMPSVMRFDVGVDGFVGKNKLCVIKSAQAGITQAVQLWVLHGCLYGKFKQGIMYIFPSDRDVQNFSQTRFTPFLKENAILRSVVDDVNNVHVRRINGVNLLFVGGRSTVSVGGVNDKKRDSSALRSFPADVVVRDEADIIDEQMREQSKQRLQASENPFEIDISTPTLPDFGIDAIWQRSDMRHWFVNCKSCKYEFCFELEFPNCMNKGKDGSYYRCCPKCLSPVDPKDGRFVMIGNTNSDTAGFWVSTLMTRLSADYIMDRFSNPISGRMNEFWNSVLGKPFIEYDDKVNKNEVYDCCSHYPMNTHYAGSTSMGVDVGKHLHCVIGIRTGQDSYQILKVERLDDFSQLYVLANSFNCSSVVIDAAPERHKAREFLQNYRGGVVHLCEYNYSQAGGEVWGRDGMVRVNRTEICDRTSTLFKYKGKLVLPMRSNEIDIYANEITSTARKLVVGANGVNYYSYITPNNVADHYYHATNYFLLASRFLNFDSFTGKRQESIRFTENSYTYR
jgi:hypothetical protein